MSAFVVERLGSDYVRFGGEGMLLVVVRMEEV
jgi:hypothetical protein